MRKADDLDEDYQEGDDLVDSDDEEEVDSASDSSGEESSSDSNSSSELELRPASPVDSSSSSESEDPFQEVGGYQWLLPSKNKESRSMSVVEELPVAEYRPVRRVEALVPIPAPINAAPRRSDRIQRSNMTAAFQHLRNNDIPAFLNMPIIRHKFIDAFHLMGKFGQGHQRPMVERLWNLAWRDLLDTKSVMRGINSIVDDLTIAGDPERTKIVRNNLITRVAKDLKRSHCIFCGLKRYLTICARDVSKVANDRLGGYLGVIGGDCFNIKFKPLLALIAECKLLAGRIQTPGFELLVHDRLNPLLVVIQDAPRRMRALYKKHLNNR